jgi:hypothetical protein
VEIGAIGILAILSLIALTLSAFGLKGYSESNRIRRELEKVQDEIRELKKQSGPPTDENQRSSFRIKDDKGNPAPTRGAWRLPDNE